MSKCKCEALHVPGSAKGGCLNEVAEGRSMCEKCYTSVEIMSGTPHHDKSQKKAETIDMPNELLALLRLRRESVRPPYMFPDIKGVLFPTMTKITISDAIYDIWRLAFVEAEEVVLGYFESLDSNNDEQNNNTKEN